MGDSNRVRWQYAVESTFGTAPTGQYQELRRTGGSLKRPINTKVSDEVQSSGQRKGLYLLSQNAEGNLEAEFSYGSFDDLLAACLRGTWTAATAVNGSLTTVKATKTVTMTGAFVGVVAGQWFQIKNSAANDGIYKVATRTSDNEVVVEDDTQMGADATAEAGVDIDTDGMLRTGTDALKSFTFEQEHLDLTQVLAFTGMRVGGFNLDIPNGDLVTLGMDLRGKDATRAVASAGSGVDAANTNDAFNSSSNIYDIREGSSPLGDQVTRVSLAYNPNTRDRMALASATPVDIRYGTADITGTLEFYFADGSLIDKYLAFTETSMSLRTTDGAGNSYVLTFPEYKYTGDLPDTGGLDQDVIVSLEFTLYAASQAYSLQVDRFAA
jgi:hypothetical protein